jgi:hypothetical protein
MQLMPVISFDVVAAYPRLTIATGLQSVVRRYRRSFLSRVVKDANLATEYA